MQNSTNKPLAVVVGASGGIGSALVRALSADPAWGGVIALGRSTSPALDLTHESSIVTAARIVSEDGRPLRLLVNAAGMLARDGGVAEKSWNQIGAAAMHRMFALNTIGPALLMRHFLPLMARPGRSVFAVLSARVGSIADNRLGGWYAYRASKAALNQLVRTASVELRRNCPEALCVAIHPGTVATALSAPFTKSGLEVQSPDDAAKKILDVLAGLDASQTGGFFDYKGAPVPW